MVTTILIGLVEHFTFFYNSTDFIFFCEIYSRHFHQLDRAQQLTAQNMLHPLVHLIG